jgi:hypothetical protein
MAHFLFFSWKQKSSICQHFILKRERGPFCMVLNPGVPETLIGDNMPKKVLFLFMVAACALQHIYPAGRPKYFRLSQEISPRTLDAHEQLFISITTSPPELKHVVRAPTPPPVQCTLSFMESIAPLAPFKVHKMPTEHPLITKVWNILEGTPLSPLPMGDLLRSIGCLSEESIARFEAQLATLTPLENPILLYDQDDDLEYIDTNADPFTPTPRAVMDRLKNILCLQKKIPPTEDQIYEFTHFLHRVRIADLDLVVDNERKWTLLHLATWHQQPVYTRLLLRFKADPNVRDFYGRTPLLLAIIVAHAAIIDLLLRYDANPDIEGKTDFGMVTPLEYINQCLS